MLEKTFKILDCKTFSHFSIWDMINIKLLTSIAVERNEAG